MPVRVFLLDDHELVRRGIRDLLWAEDDVSVVGEAATAEEALERIAATTPDVAVLDVRLGGAEGAGGVEVCREVRSAHPEVACVMLTSFADDEALFASILAGASGYVLKQIQGRELVDAIRRVAAGESLLDPAVTARVLERLRSPQTEEDPLSGLSPQERRILDLISEGKTNRQIGESMFLAEKTVKNYVSNVLAKLGMQRRSEAAAYAATLAERRRGPQPVSPLRGVDDPERLRALVEAVLIVAADLSLPAMLRRIVEAAANLLDARYCAVGVLDETHRGLAEFVYTGIKAEEAAVIGHLPEGHGILGMLIVDPRPLRLPDLHAHPDSFGFPPHHPPMTSFLGVPIRVRGQIFGNLYLTEKQGASEFSSDDEALAIALAGAAGIAIENARLHARARHLTLLEDRERIAADLHDTVIQRLFATGLALQGTVRSATPEVAERIQGAVGDLDETIRQIRSTIFALQAPRSSRHGVRNQVLSLAAEASASLGFEPHVRLDGPIDSVVGTSVGEQLLAVLREAISNVVRHAAATRVDIGVAVAGDELRLSVCDDGVGPGSLHRTGGQGVTNMEQRAAVLGGGLEVRPGPEERGTTLSWHVPLIPGSADVPERP